MTASGMELSNRPKSSMPKFESYRAQKQKGVKDPGVHFVRFQPDGSVTTIKKKVEIPPVPKEEIQQRRYEQIEREVYQKAFEEGEKTGMELGQEKMEQEIRHIIPQLENVLRELDDLPLRVYTASEQFMVESMISINRELLAHELTINSEGIAQRVRRIMDRSTGRKDIVIKVSPGIAEILGRMDEFNKIQILGDESVNPGSVVMESDFGGMEDNLESRLREVETSIRQQLQDRMDKSGVADIAAVSREKAAAEAAAELTPLVADHQPEEEHDQDYLDSEEELEEGGAYPLEAVSEEMLDGFGEDDDDFADEEEELAVQTQSSPAEQLPQPEQQVAEDEPMAGEDLAAMDIPAEEEPAEILAAEAVEDELAADFDDVEAAESPVEVAEEDFAGAFAEEEPTESPAAEQSVADDDDEFAAAFAEEEPAESIATEQPTEAADDEIAAAFAEETIENSEAEISAIDAEDEFASAFDDEEFEMEADESAESNDDNRES